MAPPERLKTRHYSAADVFGQEAVDWQQRVDFERLREKRLTRTRQAMTKHDVPVLLLFLGDNIRYATGSYQGHWKYPPSIRYAVVPAEHDPILFELANIDLANAVHDLPWMSGTHSSRDRMDVNRRSTT